MKLRGYIVCLNIYLLVYVTWYDDVISCDNYDIMSKQPPSAILDFKLFQKPQKTAANYRKVPKNFKQETIKLSSLALKGCQKGLKR